MLVLLQHLLHQSRVSFFCRGSSIAKRIQVCVKAVFDQMWSVLKRSLSGATRVFAELERATSKHINLSHLFLPKHNIASSEQGTSLFPALAAAKQQGLGLVLGTTCALLRPLGMQLRSQGTGTAETFSRRFTGFKDTIHESSRQDKEIKALWPQREVLLCVWLSAFIKTIISLTQS